MRGALGWALRQASGSRRGAHVGRRWGAQAGTWADVRARGAQATSSRRGRHGAGARQGAAARGRARQARGLGAGRSAWARGLALGCALGALDLFLAQFDSVFS